MKEKLIAWWIKGVFKGGVRTKLTAWVVGRKLNAWLKEDKMDKKWYRSKTIWANALMGIAGVITAVTTDGNLDPKMVGILGTVAGFINIVLRMITDKPIEK